MFLNTINPDTKRKTPIPIDMIPVSSKKDGCDSRSKSLACLMTYLERINAVINSHMDANRHKVTVVRTRKNLFLARSVCNLLYLQKTELPEPVAEYNAPKIQTRNVRAESPHRVTCVLSSLFAIPIHYIPFRTLRWMPQLYQATCLFLPLGFLAYRLAPW